LKAEKSSAQFKEKMKINQRHPKLPIWILEMLFMYELDSSKPMRFITSDAQARIWFTFSSFPDPKTLEMIPHTLSCYYGF